MDEKPKTHKARKHEGHAAHEAHASHESHGLARGEKSNYPTPEPSTSNSTQNILAILLVISLLANVYFIISINDLNTKLSSKTPTTLSYTTTSMGQTTVTTLSGGTGTAVVSNGKIVKVDYIGKFENGTLFDTSIESEAVKAGMTSSLKTYEPLRFVVGAGQMLTGFENGVIGMKVGEEKTITIPAGQGYTSGALANQPLIFWVKVTEIIDPQPVTVTILSDKRCTDCATRVDSILTQLKDVFPGLTSKEYDYSSAEGKKIFADSGVKALPAFLFTQDVKNAEGYSGSGGISSYLDAAGQYLNLRVGSSFDPSCYKEDGTKDCSIPACATGVECMAKTDKPVVEAFVMSHCPYGTQIEKGLIPVANLLKDKIDFSIKFCDYAMHGKKEVDEELLQYCIETEDKANYLTYLACFLNASDSPGCLKSANVNTDKVNACVKTTDTQYKVTELYNDQTKWISGQFPPFNVYKDLNTKYGVQGSPTLVLNGVVMEGVSRDSAGLLKAICATFKTAPPECSQTLSSAAPSAGFGYSTTDSASTATCG
ncbi:MAG: FKBP-type peptidyl-prolyl cis-trans isomerase [Candidatus Altiarchaeia archaeon]